MASQIETRVDTLEKLFGQFMARTGETIDRLEHTTEAIREETHTLKDEMLAFKDEMGDFKDEMLTFKNEMRDFKDEMLAFKDEMGDFKDEMLAFKNEMREFKSEMLVFKKNIDAFVEESRKNREDLNEQWGNLANRLGTLAEDIAAPNVISVAESRFNLTELEAFGVRVKRRHSTDKSRMVEIDTIAVYPTAWLVNETKSSPRTDHVEVYRALLDELPEIFPEYARRTLIPILSSLHLPDTIVAALTKAGIYGMAMSGGTMDLINFEALSDRT